MAPAKIPDRWIPYKACGKVIEGTRIICFKVPLRKAVQIGIPEIKEIWDIKTLLETIPNLGAVIDLTNTSRYYDSRELQAAGILYHKILMPGRIIPPEDKVQRFMDSVDEFLGRDCVAVQVKRARLGLSTTEFLVGVHCTHGLNRTGYMVCRYMRDRLNIPAKLAIKRFETARGYQIERENYVADILGQGDDGDHGRRKSKNSIERTRKKRENREADTKRSTENWRTVPRSSADRKSEGTSFNWNKKHEKGEYSSAWKRNKADSGSSYDYKYDY